MFQRSVVLSTLLLMWSLMGCEKPLPEGMPELFPVALLVVQDGKPLDTATVRLIPEDRSNRWASGGTTDAQGVAVLYTHGQYEGVPAGEYRVCVAKTEYEGEVPSMEDTMSGKKMGQKAFNLVETKYSLPNQTTLTVTVAKDKNVYEPVDVGKAVREPVAAPPM